MPILHYQKVLAVLIFFINLSKQTVLLIVALLLMGCKGNPSKKPKTTAAASTTPKPQKTEPSTPVKEPFKLDDKNVIPFLFEYEKYNTETKVRIKTRLGNIDILLFKETPYHRANFIFLTKKKYFDGTCFHRVVPKFIIQGGNTDSYTISKKRWDIGLYLLPPDTKKGFKHHRGVVSMPSSEIDNPHQFASPYEFFIVQQSPGAYHLDGKYTVFGKVISGMDVVDKINKIPTDKREWPVDNVTMTVELLGN